MDPRKLHAEAIVIDGHCDTLLSAVEEDRPIAQRSDQGHADVPRFLEAGVTAQIFALYPPGMRRGAAIPSWPTPGIEVANWPPLGSSAPTWQVLRLLDAFYEGMAASPDLILATKVADVRRAKAEHRLAGIIGLEGAEALRGDLGILRMLYRLGLRNLGVTWSLRNEAADGVFEARTGGGLTEFGIRLIKEANRLGIMVDIAHLAPAGVRDVMELCEAPVVDSHANARALCDHPRNLSDEQLEALAAKGGVVGVVFVPDFVSKEPGRRSVEGLLDHVDHMVRVAGVDHVGLGSDFDGYDSSQLEGMPDVTHLPAITAGLVNRGYSAEATAKILGGNWLRVYEQVVG